MNSDSFRCNANPGHHPSGHPQALESVSRDSLVCCLGKRPYGDRGADRPLPTSPDSEQGGGGGLPSGDGFVPFGPLNNDAFEDPPETWRLPVSVSGAVGDTALDPLRQGRHRPYRMGSVVSSAIISAVNAGAGGMGPGASERLPPCTQARRLRAEQKQGP